MRVKPCMCIAQSLARVTGMGCKISSKVAFEILSCDRAWVCVGVAIVVANLFGLWVTLVVRRF